MSSGPLHVCRYCDESIADPDDAVRVGHEPGNSGPGWDIWAHRAHVALVRPDPVGTAILARVLITRALRRDN
ncbi:hypothetical protein K4B79_18565 [Streptomyces lincolnensis]|uniref:hypothetical protein n=1 Tax=Streptomyces lincolnensis TaxID=1915 RepID=UPI001E4A067D|nr:hypothetical protein [Streptomyces lincolnensis]MCD7440218.1 hypothetical protein [Streptomyces lincolnensis]